MLAAYRRARRRAIFLDWGGTIVPLDIGALVTPMDSLRLVRAIESGMLSSAALTFQVQGLL